jgi:hypothetical protein
MTLRLIALYLVVLLACTISAPISASKFPADAGVINVTDSFFGALPNDGVDDSAAIQRVFDLITPSAQIVYFPAGRYDISREIYLHKTDFRAEAESLVSTGWTSVTEGSRTFLRATDAGTNADTAGRMTFVFDAIKAGRVMRLTYRTPNSNATAFFFRVNNGPWRFNNRPYNGNINWRTDDVVATDIPLNTGSNKVEIAARDLGFEIDNIAIGYLGSYFNNTIIEGEDPTTTTLRLADNATNLDGTPFSGAIVRWESGVEQFFRTAVRDITFDVGVGNPQADGLKFHGNNQSVVANVRFVGGGGSGDVALDLVHTAAIGPILVRDITVDGFAVGIHSGWQNASRTFSHIVLRNQRTFGWVNEAASTIWIDDLYSENAVQVLHNNSWRLPGDGQGRVSLINATLVGLSGADQVDAIETLGNMYVRNANTSGYKLAVLNLNQQPFRAYRGQDSVRGDVIDEWWSTGSYGGEGGGFTRQFVAPDTQLGLPVRMTPYVEPSPLTQWDGPHRHLIEITPGVFSGIADDNIDDTPSIQAAIDSGATTVYLPNGNWVLNGAITLRGNVRRFLGCEAQMRATNFTTPGKIIIGPVGPATVLIERLANFGFGGRSPRFEHASARTVIFSSVTGLDYRPTVAAPGNVFINDTVGNAILFAGGQNVWARQLNIEEDTTLVGSELDARLVNRGATVWVSGFKTEQPGVIAKTTLGGKTEILGNLQLNGFGSGTPQYVVEDASFSAVINIKPYPETGTTYGQVRETRAGDTRTTNINATGYVGFSNQTLWQMRRDIIVDNDDLGATYSGTWPISSAFPRGFIGSNFVFAAAGNNQARFAPTLPEAGRYNVYVRWIGDWGGQDHSNHATNASFSVVHAVGTASMVINQSFYSDGWYRLGAYDFLAGSAGAVTLSAVGANGKVNMDAVKFVQVVDAIFSDGLE